MEILRQIRAGQYVTIVLILIFSVFDLVPFTIFQSILLLQACVSIIAVTEIGIALLKKRD